MSTITSVAVRFAGGRSGTEHATYGQRAMHRFLENMGEGAHRINAYQSRRTPAGTGLCDVTAAIRDLVLRHESLRTRFWRDDRGELRQSLTADGVVDLTVWQADLEQDPDAAVEVITQGLKARLFDHERDWPCRLLVGLTDSGPGVVMLMFSHIAADLDSAGIVADDLAALIEARVAGRRQPVLPDRWQPLDQARYERSPAGRRRLERTMGDWHRRLAIAPRAMFAWRPGTPRPERFWRGVLRSPALAAAVNTLALRHRVSTSLVLLSAQALLLGQLARSDRCAIEVFFSNRMEPRLRQAVGNLAQESMVLVDLVDVDFRTLVKRTWAGWTSASRSSRYDYWAVRALRRDLEHSRGVAFDFESFFNDVRQVTRPDAAFVVPAARILELAHDSDFEWTETLNQETTKCSVRIEGTPAEVRVLALVDTAFLAPERTRAMLWGIERLLVWQATMDPTDPGPILSPAVVADITGVVAPQPGPGWVRVDGVWVEVRAVDELVRAALGDLCVDSTVLVEHDGDAVLLTAYLAVPATGALPSCADLHHRCVSALVRTDPVTRWTEALPQWLSAMAPHRYVVTAGRPATADPAAWRAQPVLVAGSGRGCGVVG